MGKVTGNGGGANWDIADAVTGGLASALVKGAVTGAAGAMQALVQPEVQSGAQKPLDPAVARMLSPEQQNLPPALAGQIASARKEMYAQKLPPSVQHQLSTQLDSVKTPQDFAAFQKARTAAVVANVKDGGFARAKEECNNVLNAVRGMLTPDQIAAAQGEINVATLRGAADPGGAAKALDAVMAKLQIAGSYGRALADYRVAVHASLACSQSKQSGGKTVTHGDQTVTYRPGLEQDYEQAEAACKRRYEQAKTAMQGLGAPWTPPDSPF